MRNIILSLLLSVTLLGASPATAGPWRVSRETRQVCLFIPFMECSLSVHRVTEVLHTLDGVLGVHADPLHERITVVYDSSRLGLADLQYAIEQAGFRSRPVEPAR